MHQHASIKQSIDMVSIDLYIEDVADSLCVSNRSDGDFACERLQPFAHGEFFDRAPIARVDRPDGMGCRPCE
jgi:hypothetical protein